jgi:hypothetical protein
MHVADVWVTQLASRRFWMLVRISIVQVQLEAQHWCGLLSKVMQRA